MNIPLQHGLIAIIDANDHPLIAEYHWYAQRHRHTWYALANVRRGDGSRTTIKMHRVILAAKPGQQIDHEDGNGLNNRRRNIHVATHAQNQQNQHHARTATGIIGVRPTPSGKFKATIKRNRREIHIGTFKTAADAARARVNFITERESLARARVNANAPE